MCQVCKEIFGSRLAGITDIRGVYDFKTHLKAIRPKTADRDIQTQFGLQFKASEDGSKILVRSKHACSLRVPFSNWYQILPNPRRPEAIPGREIVPPACGPKAWPELRKNIVPILSEFYKQEFRHPVHIPVEIRDEMMEFLTSGPALATPPAWIEWGEPPAVVTPTLPPPPSDPEPVATAPVGRRRRAVWRPFCQPRRSGSSQPSGNPVSSGEAANNQPANESSKPFPFPVGTWVAFDFDGDLFAGQIIKCFEGEDLCKVEFTDGDKADYEGDEIHYAAQLYQREFAK